MSERDTQSRILDTAEALVKERGFHGFSFQDIADRVGIRKASIHYHFESKAALGQALVLRYRSVMRAAADQIEAAPEAYDAWAALALFLRPILNFGQRTEDTCLGAALGGEFLSLPDPVRAEVAAFYAEQQAWLARLLEQGRTSGAFRFDAEPEALARFLFAAIEGSMIVKRAADDTAYVEGILRLAMRFLGKAA